jgi:NADPH:quinone reductase-like Zn-dependent oxidoreductase/acyl carrier protein
VPAAATAPAPAGLDPVAAAGLPVNYLTAWYGLRDLARVRPGERVLIHSATGGTGLAAVAVARAAGATVLATAGTAQKRAYLRDRLGIEHVFDSRSLEFAEQVRAATGGEGVDVVLNSLSGPAIAAGLRCLRPFGRFVELGMRDILADTALGLAPFRHNITLSTVDLIELLDRKPDEFGRLLGEVLAAVGAGTLPPLPVRDFPLTGATAAFRLMAGAGHVGKLVLTVPDGPARVTAPPPSPVRRDGAYVVTGGLRGVGLATARWLAAEGAAHVVLNGRSGPAPEAEKVLADLPCRVTVVLGDVAAPGVAERLVAAAGPALRGVVHSAMVLEDAAVTTISPGQLERVWRPKVLGARRLAEATAGLDLDWTVLYSSIASLLGNPGQGAYAAANAWLDAFAAQRTAAGRRTLAVNWGAWGETGVATDFAERGYETIPTDAGFAALRSLLVHGRVRTGVIPGAPDTWIPPSGRSSSFFAGLVGPAAAGGPAGGGAGGAGAGGAGVRAELAAAGSPRERLAVLEDHVAGHIRAVLRLGDRTLDRETPLRALGFDSLLSIELRTRLQNGLGITLASNFVWQHETLAALSTGLATQLDLD